MKISGIYKIQSLIKPERAYVGSSVDIHKRWLSHLWYLKNNKHHCSKLQRHYNKYGKNDLVFSILIGCDKNDLLTTEQFYLDSIPTWFNTCKVAGNTTGRKLSDKTKKLLSSLKIGKPTWNKGKKLTDEHKKNIAKSQEGKNNSFYGKHHTDEFNEKMKEFRLTYVQPQESREKQRQSLLKYYENKRNEEKELASKN